MSDSTISADVLHGTPLGELLEADLPTRLAALEALGSAIAAGDLQDERDLHTGPELGVASVRVHRLCTRLTGKRYQWLTVEEADGRWATTAFHPRTYASHVAHTHGISYANARRSVRLARQLRDDIPRFGAALRAGQIGPDQVDALATTALTSPTRIAALAEPITTDATTAESPGAGESDLDETAAGDVQGEATNCDEAATDNTAQTVEDFLLAQAQDMRVDQIRRLGKHFAQVADPEADERGYRQAKEREYVELVRTLDGWHLSGFLTEENGRLVRAAMDAVITPPAPDDQRTADQRRAQALADLAHLVLDQGLAGTHASVRPHLGVLINPTDLDRLLREAREGTTAPTEQTPCSTPAPGSSRWDTIPLHNLIGIDWATQLNNQPPTFDDGTGPVPPALLRRLATCGDLYRVLFSPEGEVINLGRTRRLFTPAQRRALIARDQGCTWPGCTAPPAICESHHARIHWANGGPTNTTNGALLCYHHHTVVDARTITMTRTAGVWIFTRTDGTIINTNLDPPTKHHGWPDTG
ncbi:HNH endonuclease signature motif containing protein [Ruania zhangjianzhongii]|uniref:HNH endonuclease signature motif containing protein n=1 Tax=Ruania zhangjianzhongii TaxID=2603206 RepID=UPI0011C9F713|nr:HNH endonuclease signature motif containing protein [Ruania zhangjianzhongii]